MSNSNQYGVWAGSVDRVWHDVRLAMLCVPYGERLFSSRPL